MENEKKSDSSQNVLNVILVIICGAIMGLFVYDYINKNNQIAEYKASEEKRTKATEEQLARVNKLTDLVKETSYSNVPEGLVSEAENEKIKMDIAKNVTNNLSPIIAKMDKGQDMTNEKLDKIMNELIDLLEKETQKSAEIRAQMSAAIEKERQIEGKLQQELTETNKVVADLSGMVGELKVLYIDAHGEDSSLGDIGRIVKAVPDFVGNTFTFDWWASRDRRRANEKIEAKQIEIMERFEAIGNPEAAARQAAEKAAKKEKIKKIKEPELIDNK